MLICADAAAYHFWIRPENHNLYPGDEVACPFLVGTQEEEFRTPYNSERITSFKVHHGRKSTDLEGLNGSETGVVFKAQEEGLFLMAYRSTPTEYTYANNAFEEYITRMGLMDALERFQELRNRKRIQSERHVVCAKTMLRVGQPKIGHDVVCKMPLEIVPLGDPRGLSPGRALRLSLYRNGRRIENGEIRGWRLDRECEPMVGTTNEKGVVRMEIELGGKWLFTAIRMAPEPWDDENTPPEIDWKTESASLTLSF
jgi:uncharacterized GH25 family protein